MPDVNFWKLGLSEARLLVFQERDSTGDNCCFSDSGSSGKSDDATVCWSCCAGLIWCVARVS